jgi:hypothetical protein
MNTRAAPFGASSTVTEVPATATGHDGSPAFEVPCAGVVDEIVEVAGLGEPPHAAKARYRNTAESFRNCMGSSRGRH